MNDDNLNDVWRAEEHYGTPDVDDRGPVSYTHLRAHET